MAVGAMVALTVALFTWDQRTEAMAKRVEAIKAGDLPLFEPPRAPSRPEGMTADEALALAGAHGVVCALSAPLNGPRARLHADLPSPYLGLATVGGGWVVLSDVPDEGEGELRVEGYGPLTVRWSTSSAGPVRGGCAPSPLVLEPGEATVRGVVRPTKGVTVEACGRPVVLGSDGSFTVDASVDRGCRVVARRHYGVLRWEAEITVRPDRHRDPSVTVDTPAVDAVLPFVLVADGGALLIAEDWSGAGLEGQTLVEVGGRPAKPDPRWALEVGGADGEVVEVRLGDGRTLPVTLRALGFDDWLNRQRSL
jgi:hypothetical protein